MKLGVDIGGTFTDLVAFDPDTGEVTVSKALNGGLGPRAGVQDALATAGIDNARVSAFTHGTTVVTNLLIERDGATVGLVCTRGFRDLLEIQESWRERTFDVHYVKSRPLVPRERRLEIGGRIDTTGAETEPLDADEVRTVVAALIAAGADSLVVALYNAYANPDHERAVREIAAEVAPDVPVTLSTDVDPRIGEFERVSTAALNAMAVPKVGAYVSELDAVVPASIEYMHSAGGLIPPAEAAARPIQLALSGPAGGVLAAQVVASSLGIENAITMDIGGTSCDVCLIWGGEVRYRDQVVIETGVPARVRAVDVHTVGAGGGSIAHQDRGGSLQVGPISAGALPGPACYGRGGEQPTVTDANLRLGILPAEGLLGGRLSLDAQAAEAALARLGEQFGTDADGIARGIYSVINANMAQTIREITVRQGVDPRECALIAFGGAGAQHASGVAQELAMRRVVVPANSSVLSAVGLLTAQPRATATRTVMQPIEALGTPALDRLFAALEAEAAGRLGASDAPPHSIRRYGGLRYVGQSHEVPVDLDAGPEEVTSRFEAAHEQLFGTRLGEPVEIVDISVDVLRARGADVDVTRSSSDSDAVPRERDTVLFDGPVPVRRRADLTSGASGPCLVQETNSVTVVPDGATVRTVHGHLVIELP